MKKLYAWAWKNSPTKINEWRDQVSPKLGLILYPNLLEQARLGDIAYVNNADQARKVVQKKDIISHVILSDERNMAGPSGAYETPEAYNKRIKDAYQILNEAGIPTSTKGLGMTPSFGIPGLLMAKTFDQEYHDKITINGARGVNYNPVDFHRMLIGIRDNPKKRFFVTMIPWRFRWNFLVGFIWQSLTVPGVRRQFELLASDPQVKGVGVWCLHEGYAAHLGRNQDEHGLLDGNGSLTWQGRMVKQILEG